MGGVCTKSVKRSTSVAPEEVSQGAAAIAAGPPEPAPSVAAASAPGGQLQRTRTMKAARRGSVSAEVASLAAVQGKKSLVPKTQDTRRRLSELIKSTLLFNELDDDQETAVIDALFERKVVAGEAIIREGEVGDNFYLIESGRFQASKGGETKFTYDGKGSFGELALMYNCPRAATITAEIDGVLWGMDRASFRAVIVSSMVERRQKFEATLQSMDLFKHLSTEQLAAIADCVTVEQYEAGEHIIRENEELATNAKFYMIDSGTVECLRTFEGKKRLTKTLGTGDVFGEVALLTKAPRQADCVAATKVKCLSMSRDAFERLMGPVEKSLARHIAEYEQLNADVVSEGSRTPAGPTPAPAVHDNSGISTNSQGSRPSSSQDASNHSAAGSRAITPHQKAQAESRASEGAGAGGGSAGATGPQAEALADSRPASHAAAQEGAAGDRAGALAEGEAANKSGAGTPRSGATSPAPGSPSKLAAQIKEWEHRLSGSSGSLLPAEAAAAAAAAASVGSASAAAQAASGAAAAPAEGAPVATAAGLARKSGSRAATASTEGGEVAALAAEAGEAKKIVDLTAPPAEVQEEAAPALEPIKEDPSKEGSSRRGTRISV